MNQSQVYAAVQTLLRESGFSVIYDNSPSSLTATKDNLWYLLENSPGQYRQIIITSSTVPSPPAADSPSLLAELNRGGRAHLQGIHFDQ
jgi:hypothetical protein